MKDRKFWEGLGQKAADRISILDTRIRCLDVVLVGQKNIRRRYQNRRVQQRIESKIAHLWVEKKFWEERQVFYQGRVRILEQRTRYQRIQRTPVI